jgi:dienelactone hydrolase
MKLLLSAMLSLAAVGLSAAVTPPGQPASGPGGAAYLHTSVAMSSHGTGGQAYVLFEPQSPAPTNAPVIVFNHGWNGFNPASYGAWIRHLVRRGNVVIYPKYQASALTPPREITTNAVVAIQDALARLNTEPGRVRPDTNRFAIVGHSAGGMLTMNLAARATANNLPMPKALMSVEPGRTWTGSETTAIPLDALGGVPPATLLLVVVGEADATVRDVDGRKIFYGATGVPLDNKDFVTVRSDTYGTPDLDATHLAPCAVDNAFDDGSPKFPGSELLGGLSTNALDFFGTWKLFDALSDAAFYGTNRDYALGNTSQQRFMGHWSDGRPVNELGVTDAPPRATLNISAGPTPQTITLLFLSEADVPWRLFSSSDLVDWTTSVTNGTGNGSGAVLTLPAASPKQFFRLAQPE